MVLSERTACYLFGLAIALGPIGTARAQCDDGFTPALSTVNAQFDRTGISVHTRWPVREWEARRGVELEVLLPQIRRTGIEYYWPTNQLRSAYSPDLPARYQYVDTPTEDECEKWVVGTTRPTDLAGRVRLFFHGRETLPAGVTAGRFQTQLVDFDWLWGRLDRACAECRNATTSWTIYVTTDSVEYADYASGLRPEWTCAGPSLGYVATASSATGTDGGYTEMRRHDCAAWTTSMWSTDRAEGAGTCTDTAAWFAVRGN